MEKVSALLNSLDLGGQDSSSAPGVDSTILDLITNQRWFRDAVFTAGYLSDVDIGRARATASVVDRLCAPRALRVVACAGLRGLAQTEGLPAIGTAVAVYEDGGDAAALIKTVLNAVVRSSAREKYTAVDLRVVSKLALACPRAVADAVTFVDAFAAGVSPVSSVDFQIQAWGPNVCCDVSRRPLDLQALFIAAALRAPYRSYAGNIRHTALARIAELVQDDNEDLNAAGYAALRARASSATSWSAWRTAVTRRTKWEMGTRWPSTPRPILWKWSPASRSRSANAPNGGPSGIAFRVTCTRGRSASSLDLCSTMAPETS